MFCSTASLSGSSHAPFASTSLSHCLTVWSHPLETGSFCIIVRLFWFVTGSFFLPAWVLSRFLFNLFMSWLFLTSLAYFRGWSGMVFLQPLLLCLTSLPSPPGASVLHTLLLWPHASLRVAWVLWSCWLLPRSRSRHLVCVAAWLPRVPRLCTSFMEPPSLLSTSLAPVSLFSGVVWLDVGEGPQPPCHPPSLLQAKSWTHPTPFFALHLQPSRALTLCDLSWLLLHCMSHLPFILELSWNAPGPHCFSSPHPPGDGPGTLS